MKPFTISPAIFVIYVLFVHSGHAGEEFIGGQEYMRNKIDATNSTALDVRVRVLPGEKMEIIMTNTGADPILFHDILGINEDKLPGIWIRGCSVEQEKCENEVWRHPYVKDSHATPVWSLQLETLEPGNAVKKVFSIPRMLLKFGIDDTHNISRIQVKIRTALDEYASKYAEYTSIWMNIRI